MAGIRLCRSDIRSYLAARTRAKNVKIINKCFFGGKQTLGEKIVADVPKAVGLCALAGVSMVAIDQISPIYQNIPDIGNAVKASLPLSGWANVLFFGGRKIAQRNANLDGLLLLVESDKHDISSSIVEVLNGLKPEDRSSLLKDISTQKPELFSRIEGIMKKWQDEQPATIELNDKIKGQTAITQKKEEEIGALKKSVEETNSALQLLATPSAALTSPEKETVKDLKARYARGAQLPPFISGGDK